VAACRRVRQEAGSVTLACVDADAASGVAVLPDPALVVLIGPSCSGKSSWAAERYLAPEIVSSDQLRGVVGSGERDLGASAEAFALLDQIAAARTRRGLTTVLDTLGLDDSRRRGYLELARRAGLPAVAVLFSTGPAACRERNRARDQPIPAPVLQSQLRRMAAVAAQVAAEGWDVVAEGGNAGTASPPHPPGTHPPVSHPPTGRHTASRQPAGQQPAGRPTAGQPTAGQPTVGRPTVGRLPAERQPGSTQQRPPARLEFMLQISRFGWGDDPAGWLKAVALAAAESGFRGIALMDHLIQIPQVGRAWEPIPKPWVTLGMLAGLDTGLRLGTLVTPVTFRAPGVLAKSVATLDVLSGGRAFCGIGAGWWDREHAAFGLPFPPPRDRLDLLETAIETLRALWQPGTRPHQGARVTLPETTCYPRPGAAIPVIVGGSGERRTLRIAARLGDGCNLPADLDTLDRKLAVLREHCAQAGRDPAEVLVTVLDIPVIGRDRAHVAQLVERLRGRTSAPAFARRHHAGTPDDHIGRYRLLAQRGVATVFVSLPDLSGPEDVLRLAPILAAFS
jgi:alkanesulfonate monooxygenase SsuD/methylene tetrahydromethanopterin reductase-like flavin-dependent oxidoreductase (luciferase family)/predicted kinase